MMRYKGQTIYFIPFPSPTPCLPFWEGRGAPVTNDDEALGERTCSKSCVTSEFEVFLKGREGREE